jgi:hypothetical protein
MIAQSVPLTPPVIAPGRVVKLDDGRIGIVEYAWESPYCGKPQVERAYVVGIEKEFAVWASREQIVRVYGVPDGVASVAAEAATPA